MNDFFLFLKNPVPPFNSKNEENFKIKIITVFKIFWITLGLTVVAILIGLMVDAILVSVFSIKSLNTTFTQNFKNIANKFGHFKFFFVVIYVPALEELIFRLPLKIKTSFISFSLGMLLYSLFGFSYTHFEITLLKPYLGVLLFLVSLPLALNFILKKLNVVELIIKNYKVYFYLLATGFALVHIGNFKPINYNLIFLYPFYVLPQFVMGVSMGYVRNKYGLQYSLLLHSLINLPHGIF